jgi:hypothetical protein
MIKKIINHSFFFDMQPKVKLLGYFVNDHKLKLENYVTLIDPTLNEFKVLLNKKKQKIYFMLGGLSVCLVNKMS